MNIFDQYGIKEVADVTLFSIHKKKDGSGELYYLPALYLDTLKISSIEKTAENVWAEGGLGNSRLICWDFGKTIDVTLEDALCTPASLGLCWGGILNADWKDGEVDHQYGISYAGKQPVERISRMEKTFYPRNDRENAMISKLIPFGGEEEDVKLIEDIQVEGFGYVLNRPFVWRLEIDEATKRIYTRPDRIYGIDGKKYLVDQDAAIVYTEPTIPDEFKYSVLYTLENGDVLEVRVDNDNIYTIFVGGVESEKYSTSVFKSITMCVEFDNTNSLIYYILTKHENDIVSVPGDQLWSYVSTKTLTPYDDDYWFHRGEPYYVKSLTIAPKKQNLKAKRIQIKASEFPGMYKLVGETYIRERDTHEDQRMQITIPMCKVMSEHNLTLEAAGDPTVFSMNLEVARPQNGIMMELTEYEIEEKTFINEQGIIEAKDGSTKVLSE